MKNQCDGCRRGAPLTDGMHDLSGFKGSYPGELMYCTAHLYGSVDPRLLKVLNQFSLKLHELEQQHVVFPSWLDTAWLELTLYLQENE